MFVTLVYVVNLSGNTPAVSSACYVNIFQSLYCKPCNNITFIALQLRFFHHFNKQSTDLCWDLVNYMIYDCPPTPLVRSLIREGFKVRKKKKVWKIPH